MTAQAAFDANVEQKIEQMTPYLMKMANGDEDLVQEGAIGVWEAMERKPEASDAYFKRNARWKMLNLARGVGKSIDIPKWYERKTPIYLVRLDDNGEEAGQISEAVLSDPNRGPMDEAVIDKVDFERFLATLTMREAGYLLMKLVWEVSDHEAADRMDISREWLRQMKAVIRRKVEAFYAV